MHSINAGTWSSQLRLPISNFRDSHEMPRVNSIPLKAGSMAFNEMFSALPHGLVLSSGEISFQMFAADVLSRSSRSSQKRRLRNNARKKICMQAILLTWTWTVWCVPKFRVVQWVHQTPCSLLTLHSAVPVNHKKSHVHRREKQPGPPTLQMDGKEKNSFTCVWMGSNQF